MLQCLAGFTYVIRSLRSLPFLRPPKAILVPGINFLGFSRYLNYIAISWSAEFHGTILYITGDTHERLLVPGHASLLVGIGVGVAVDLTGLTAEETVKLGTDFVATVSLDGVALGATGLLGGRGQQNSRNNHSMAVVASLLTWKSLAPLAESPGRQLSLELGFLIVAVAVAAIATTSTFSRFISAWSTSW